MIYIYIYIYIYVQTLDHMSVWQGHTSSMPSMLWKNICTTGTGGPVRSVWLPGAMNMDTTARWSVHLRKCLSSVSAAWQEIALRLHFRLYVCRCVYAYTRYTCERHEYVCIMYVCTNLFIYHIRTCMNGDYVRMHIKHMEPQPVPAVSDVPHFTWGYRTKHAYIHTYIHTSVDASQGKKSYRRKEYGSWL